MDWLEQNLDAYRIIAEILDDLRETLRSRLDRIHGREWYKVGLPQGVLDRLVESKEQEKAIDWYESEYQQIMSYALFPDLLEILEHNADAFPQILGLAPTTALLNARFLELEVMRAKLGRARPISETELSFLGTFHLRFRKAIENHRAHQDTTDADSSAAASPPARETGAQPATPQRPLPPPVEAVKPPDDLVSPPRPQAPVADPPPVAPAEAEAATDATETEAYLAEPPIPEEQPADVPETAAADPPDVPAADVAAEEPSNDTPRELTFNDALAAGDDQTIFRELYKEVTAIAEGIWTKDIPPPARVWEMVAVSDWYEKGFSTLGLRPLSDFYDIISKVDRKMREGAAKEQLQDFLKEANFAQTLLALRDMFQKNHI